VKSFSATEAIKFGWGVAKSRWQLFLTLGCLNVVLSLVPYLPDWIFGEATTQADIAYLVIFIPLVVVNLIISVGMMKIPIMLVDGKDAKFSDVWVTNWKLLVKFLFGTALSGLIVLGGLILLIIPGIIFAMKLMFVPYFIIDKNLGAVDAIKASWKATKGNLMELFLLGALCMLVVIVGALALLIGLVWAIPTTIIASAYAYRKLSVSSQA